MAHAEQNRPSPRPEVRDPAKRAAEIEQQLDGVDVEGNDEFHFDTDKIPAGWSYEWKRETVWGKEDPSYTIELRQMGWEPVPTSRHPEMMPAGTKGDEPIRRKGQMLMERPKTVTDKMKRRDHLAAVSQVRNKEEQLGLAPPGTFERQVKGAPLAKVGKSFEPMPIPKD